MYRAWLFRWHNTFEKVSFMDEHAEVYEKLAEHLDRLPEGYPRTPTGVEIRILRRLFTPEQAVLAQLLALVLEAPDHSRFPCASGRTGDNAI